RSRKRNYDSSRWASAAHKPGKPLFKVATRVYTSRNQRSVPLSKRQLAATFCDDAASRFRVVDAAPEPLGQGSYDLVK
ncbi:MAG: hypothetical protein M3R67_14900, partial [Acidobacteriota bacterium]|nr:hypothetical protein [Acidobacteriota bacterium]